MSTLIIPLLIPIIPLSHISSHVLFTDNNMEVVEEENKKVSTASASTVTKTSYSGEVSVNILQDTLAWGHLCPTSPGE